MNKLINGMIIISLLVQANFLCAEVYRSQDTNGNISFSDKPSSNATLQKSDTHSQRYKNKVAYVYDGDTIKLENGEKIRLLGIDTPEVASHYRKATPGGNVAKKWLTKRLEGADVYLEYDQEKRDKYKRVLAHVFLKNGEHINVTLVKEGLAIVNLFPPNLRYKNELLAAQKTAQQQHLGMWAMKRYQLTSADKVRKVSGWKRYQGTVQSIKNNRKYVRLFINKKLNIRIAKQNLYLFPDLETYIGQKVEVRGWLSGKKSPFSILVRHPSALIISD
ncbi:MAG: thermonuclease family protein [Methylophaga sp.]|nr:thermonuclease family protein [Methylophaga sp.]